MAVRSVNEVIADELTRHSIDLQRFAEDERLRALGFLKQMELEIVGRLAQEDPDLRPGPIGQLTPARRRRLEALLQQTRETIRTAYTALSRSHATNMRRLAKVEAEAARGAINQVVGITLATTALEPNQLRTLVSSTLIEGAPASEWLGRMSGDLAEKLKNQMRMGFAQGETVQQLVQRVRGHATGRRVVYEVNGKKRVYSEFRGGIMDVGTRHAEAIVRTSVNSIANEARIATFRANDDVIRYLQHRSTIDLRVSEICFARSGLLYELDGTPVNHDVPFLNGPPYHFNCRSQLTPVLYSYDELSGSGAVRTGGRPTDIDTFFRRRLKEQGFTSEQIANTMRNTQQSMDGQIPSDVSLEDWLRGKSDADQQRILGKGKWELWRSGKLPSPRDLLDQTGRPLTLDALERKLGL